MARLDTMLILPASLLVLIAQAAADQPLPTAIRKLSPDSNEKLLSHHLAFAPQRALTPGKGAAAAFDFLESQDASSAQDNIEERSYHPAFARHHNDSEENMLRRAAEALALLERRAACPANMNSCVPSASAKPETSTLTVVQTNTREPGDETITATRTTFVEGNPSTVVVTEVITRTASGEDATRTTTKFVTESDDEGTVPGNPPWRPTGTTLEETTDSTITDTQTGCPTGFYGCLARHGGGCCQTDRDCQTHSCPPVESTTIISDGKTLVVPVTDVPSEPTSTCAGGWFLCGDDAGPVAGCCPSGYKCGTASCFTAEATQTESVQKQQPKEALASDRVRVSFVGLASAIAFGLGLAMM
ncbi:hypothetical protein K4F52_007863 [Lecanicillium sp. MT-2017a]|nr:hypothetical protein K4F52_007863 [Lecanicillium sp. MT-2017a]